MNLEEKVKETKTPLNYSGYEEFFVKNPYEKKEMYDYMWKYEKQQWLFRFKNNYGASVIKHWGSYGFENDLFELAVIYFDNNKWNLSYNTLITDNVIGYLTNDEVLEYLDKIKRLDEHGR